MTQMTAKRNDSARWERVTALMEADILPKQGKQSREMTKLTALLYIGGGVLIGWSLRVMLEVLASRNGWHVGGEVLVLPTMLVCIALGIDWGRKWRG